MAKKNKGKSKETTIENYYDLRVDKVDELVAALKGEDTENEEPVSYKVEDCIGKDAVAQQELSDKRAAKEFDPYKVDKLSRIPAWLKAFFIKFWFAGAVCYFVMFGIQFADTLDTVIITGVVLGVVVDMLVNSIFRYMESDRKEYNAYMMFPFPFKKFWTFFTNIIYYVIVLIAVYYCYEGLNLLISSIKGTTDKIHVGVEPLLFGVLALIVDMFFIGIKDLIVYLVKRGKRKKEEMENV